MCKNYLIIYERVLFANDFYSNLNVLTLLHNWCNKSETVFI